MMSALIEQRNPALCFFFLLHTTIIKADNMNAPEHPGQPKWQNFKEWNTMKKPSSFQVVRTAQESREELLAKFGLQDEDGNGWGDASDAQDAGWGSSNAADGQGGGWN